MQPVYVMCMSGPSVDLGYLRDKMGRHVVKIHNSAALLNAVVEVVGTLIPTDRSVLFVKLIAVRYDKDGVGVKPIDTVTASYSQKPSEFSPEHEVRLAVGLSGPRRGAPEELLLTLNSPTVFCEAVPDSAGQGPA